MTEPEQRRAEASAFGRVNLMGDHTDYNDGFVLPALIPQHTRATITVRDDVRVVMRSDAVTPESASYEIGAERKQHGWIDYVQGVTATLRASGHAISGFEGELRSSVPSGAGLASSAALEVALLRALREAFGLSLDDVRLAQLAQRAEVEFVGAPVGIMDQLVASLGEIGSALFVDTRTLATRTIPLPPELALIVIHSGVTHAHGQGQYGQRRAECRHAAQQLGVSSLRELDAATAELDALAPVLRRRVQHVLSENQRVLETADALAAVDRRRLAALFERSHASLRDDYEVSAPEVDQLVAIGVARSGVLAARLTGGGFGGSVVMLAEPEAAAGAAAEIATRYEAATGRRAQVLVPRAERSTDANSADAT